LTVLCTKCSTSKNLHRHLCSNRHCERKTFHLTIWYLLHFSFSSLIVHIYTLHWLFLYFLFTPIVLIVQCTYTFWTVLFCWTIAVSNNVAIAERRYFIPRPLGTMSKSLANLSFTLNPWGKKMNIDVGVYDEVTRKHFMSYTVDWCNGSMKYTRSV